MLRHESDRRSGIFRCLKPQKGYLYGKIPPRGGRLRRDDNETFYV
jgi:hypothetical protein